MGSKSMIGALKDLEQADVITHSNGLPSYNLISTDLIMREAHYLLAKTQELCFFVWMPANECPDSVADLAQQVLKMPN
jgi:hypothetical protein